MHTPRSSANGMNHTCLCFPSRSWYSFTDPGGMEGWVGLRWTANRSTEWLLSNCRAVGLCRPQGGLKRILKLLLTDQVTLFLRTERLQFNLWLENSSECHKIVCIILRHQNCCQQLIICECIILGHSQARSERSQSSESIYNHESIHDAPNVRKSVFNQWTVG